jgi:hypothetical protein
MKKYRNFQCSNTNEIFERRVEDDITIVKCACGNEANRIISAGKYFSNSTGRSPSAATRK